MWLLENQGDIFGGTGSRLLLLSYRLETNVMVVRSQGDACGFVQAKSISLDELLQSVSDHDISSRCIHALNLPYSRTASHLRQDHLEKASYHPSR
jgi:hypothetical protein